MTEINWAATATEVAMHLVRIVLVVLLARLACSALHRVLPRAFRLAALSVKNGRRRDEAELAQRQETLNSVVYTTARVVIWGIASFMALSEIGVNIAPVLASVSVVSIAVAFGAQSLVKDVLAGLFILVEDQYRKGDVVKLAGISGMVEDVNLRRTVLRDLDGTVHHVPNSQIAVASNLTRDWSRVNLDVSVSYSENLDRVVAVINRVGQEMAADSYFGPLIIEPPKVLRLDAFAESAISLKILGVVKPMKQWEVAGELRWRIKRSFDAEGIEIPFPHRVLISRSSIPESAVAPPAEEKASVPVG